MADDSSRDDADESKSTDDSGTDPYHIADFKQLFNAGFFSHFPYEYEPEDYEQALEDWKNIVDIQQSAPKFVGEPPSLRDPNPFGSQYFTRLMDHVMRQRFPIDDESLCPTCKTTMKLVSREYAYNPQAGAEEAIIAYQCETCNFYTKMSRLVLPDDDDINSDK